MVEDGLKASVKGKVDVLASTFGMRYSKDRGSDLGTSASSNTILPCLTYSSTS